MKKLYYHLILFATVLNAGCKNEDNPPPINQTLTYYPNTDEAWASLNTDSLGWDNSEIQSLYKLLEDNGTRGFLVLIDGKIALENYWGNGILNISPFTDKSDWYWASAGKTLTSFMVMKAQEEGYLNLSDKTSTYLGKGWTSCSPQQEDLITIWHQLTMTSGLDDGVAYPFNTAPENLQYKSDAGKRWSYHNAPYTLLDSVVTSAVNTDFDNYFNTRLCLNSSIA